MTDTVLVYDDEGFTTYHGMRIRRPMAEEERWAVFSDRLMSWHACESFAMRSVRNVRHAELILEMEALEVDGVDVIGGPSVATSVRCAEYDEILRLVCGYLELPQSESGPADDIRLYDRALEAADLYTKQADADLAENKRLRFAAEADLARLLEALGPVVSAARMLPDPRSLVEGSTARKEAEFLRARAGLSPDEFHRILLAVENMNPAYQQQKKLSATCR